MLCFFSRSFNHHTQICFVMKERKLKFSYPEEKKKKVWNSAWNPLKSDMRSTIQISLWIYLAYWVNRVKKNLLSLKKAAEIFMQDHFREWRTAKEQQQQDTTWRQNVNKLDKSFNHVSVCDAGLKLHIVQSVQHSTLDQA